MTGSVTGKVHGCTLLEEYKVSELCFEAVALPLGK